MLFNYQKTNIPIRYHFLKEEDSIFMKGRVQNNIEALIEVECGKSDENENLFSVKILKYKQSNPKGFYKWVEDLSFLRKNLLLNLDENNQLGDILNIQSIQQDFVQAKLKLTIDHSSEKTAAGVLSEVEKIMKNPARFSELFRFGQPHLLLFPGFYGKVLSEDEPVQGYRELPNFVHLKKVPIKTIEKLGNGDKEHQEILVKGELDKENFDQEKLTSFIRLIRNRPRVPSILELNYTERYRINIKDNWAEQAMCMSLAMVPGTLYQQERTILKRVTQ